MQKNETVDIKFFLKKSESSYSVYIVNPDNSRIDLEVVDNKVSFVPEKEGLYIVCVQGEERMVNKKEFIVTEIGSETLDPGRDTIFLKKLAEISGGMYFDIEDAADIERVLSVQKVPVRKRFAVSDETEKYLMPAIFILLSICWFLRRRDNIL